MINNRIFVIIGILFFQGCASVLTIDKETLKFTSDSTKRISCIAEPKIKLTSIGFGIAETQTSSNSKMRDDEILLIKREFSKVFDQKTNCQKNMVVDIEIVNEPIEDRRALLLLNLITIGIIPYWAEHRNYLTITVYDENGKIDQRYTSSLNYERVQSFFLFPVTAFYIDSNIELNLKTIPMHFNNISEEIHKSTGLK